MTFHLGPSKALKSPRQLPPVPIDLHPNHGQSEVTQIDKKNISGPQKSQVSQEDLELT